MDSHARVSLLGQKQPNGPVYSGNDNLAFVPDNQNDRFKRREISESGIGVSEFRQSLELEDLDPKVRTQETDDDYSDSNLSQHDWQDLDDGSVGMDSRMADFEGEIDDNEDRPWDVFEEKARENLAHADRQFWSRVNVVSRIVLIVVLFVFVLGLTSVSSFAFLVIVYNMNATGQNFTLSKGQNESLFLQRASGTVSVRWVWAAMMVTSARYFFTLCSCVVKMCVKRTRGLTWRALVMALALETVHSVGLGAFVFVVAPSYDPVMVIMLSQFVGFVPALMQLRRVKRPTEPGDEEEIRWSFLDLVVLATTMACLGLVVWRLHRDSWLLTVLTPLSLVFLSVEWWENFVPVKEIWKRLRKKEYRQIRCSKKAGMKEKRQTFKEGSFLFRAKYAIRDRKTKIEAACAVWKIFLNLAILLAVFASRGQAGCASALFYTADGEADCSLWKLDLSSSGTGWCLSYFPFVVAAVGILASGAAYKAAKVACKIHAQRLCFSLPLVLSAPVTLAAVVSTYRHPLSLADCSSHLRWPMLAENENLLWLLEEYTKQYWLPVLLGGLLVIGLTTRHVWSPSAERVASTDKLFVRPLYCGVMFGASLLLNRAVDDNDVSGLNMASVSRNAENWTSRLEKKTEENDSRVDEEMQNSTFPRIYACATMWHETAVEMTQLLKSLFRMDQDQFTRACMWKRFNIVDKDFYIYEAHIFFDDAFTKEEKRGEDCFSVNSFVKQFLEVVDEAARSIYPANVSIPPPTKMDTPYGGRLTYMLPGGNPMVVHLKNKFLVRHKKRWSQVMYMYYLLSYKLLMGSHSGSKRQLADNTFLLALDGDVDFYPDSVQLLVDRMRRNNHVGAACGRIHPIGSGLMVWYQKFEYAVSHWMQKATEHIFGCVLCSPGCFSLFRGSALMEDNVLRRYTKLATTARHAVQYDMGEDRWLCTLILQQGKRVEYAAAADALTFCPDDFGEFYKQRRRWTPSTMANILDLLSDWRHVTRVNGSISLLFIAYQAFLFVSSVLTPGTIFLLILGAINTAYPTLPLYGAMLVNLMPIVVFIVLCFSASPDIQIAYATILSTVYSLVMMVVLVGLLRQVAESGMCSVTAIFFVGVAGVFVLAALLHPQEVGNLLFGLLYFLAIPSMSMLLVFYAVANLNVVTWGTRDVNKASSGKQEKSTLQRFHGGIMRMVSMTGGQDMRTARDDDVTSDYTFSFGNLFRCICCPTKKANDGVIERLEDIENALYSLRMTIKGLKDLSNDDKEDWSPVHPPDGDDTGFPFIRGEKHTSNPLFCDAEANVRPDVVDPFEGEFWFEDRKLDSGAREYLDHDERVFWEQLIEKYLKPLDQDPEYKHKQEAITTDLTNLRNKAAMLFFLGNALFVTIIFILESVSEYTPGLTIELPCDKGHIGQKLEPISVTFTVVFGILLMLQFVGMVMHRFSTLVHIVAATSVRPKKSGSASENYTLFGRRHEYYDLTVDMLWTGARSVDSNHSAYTSYMEGESISRETLKTSDFERNIMSKLIVRQKTRKQSLRRQNLYDVVDERLRPMIDLIDKQSPARGEAGGSAEEGGGGGGEGGGVDEGEEAGRRTDGEDGSDAPVIPPGLNWLRVRSLAAVMSLAQDPEKRNLVRRRTEQAQKRWKDTINKVKPNPRAPTLRDIVELAKKKKAEEGGGKDEAGEDGRKEQGTANLPSVSFGVLNEKARSPGAGILKAATAGGPSDLPGVPTASRWGKVRASGVLKKPGDRGASTVETVPLGTVAEVHHSGSGPTTGSPGKSYPSTSTNTLKESELYEEGALAIPSDDDVEDATKF